MTQKNDLWSKEYFFLEDFFQEDPQKMYSCPICLAPVQREAFLTGCCGNHFCKQCIVRLARSHRPCPMCKSNSLRIFPNKERQREINELQVNCPLSLGLLPASSNTQGSGSGKNYREGSSHGCPCNWAGELGHLERHLKTHGLCCEESTSKTSKRNEMTGQYTPHHSSSSERRHTSRNRADRDVNANRRARHGQEAERRVSMMEDDQEERRNSSRTVQETDPPTRHNSRLESSERVGVDGDFYPSSQPQNRREISLELPVPQGACPRPLGNLIGQTIGSTSNRMYSNLHGMPYANPSIHVPYQYQQQSSPNRPWRRYRPQTPNDSDDYNPSSGDPFASATSMLRVHLQAMQQMQARHQFHTPGNLPFYPPPSYYYQNPVGYHSNATPSRSPTPSVPPVPSAYPVPPSRYPSSMGLRQMPSQQDYDESNEEYY